MNILSVLRKSAKKILSLINYRDISSKSILFEIDNFLIDLGKDHNLPNFMNAHPMYDRFVPYLGVLADKVASGSEHTIIDIGANVGDTVAGIIKHTSATIICVEPTKIFFELLQKNVISFGKEYSDRVKMVQAYISNNANIYISKINHGTAVKIKAKDDNLSEAISLTLPELLTYVNIDISNVSLIKIDTDGYDHECILSISDKLKNISPILYWENAISNLQQKNDYTKMTNFIKNNNYTNFYIFDNFGNYQCKVDSDGMTDINEYLYRMQNNIGTRSYYYVDVLACKPEHEHLCRETINQYINSFKEKGEPK